MDLALVTVPHGIAHWMNGRKGGDSSDIIDQYGQWWSMPLSKYLGSDAIAFSAPLLSWFGIPSHVKQYVGDDGSC